MLNSRTCTFRPTVSSAPDLTRRILRHERALVAASVLALAALGWWYIAMTAGIRAGAEMGMRQPSILILVLMWWLMMAAMMLPSATPAFLLYAHVRHARNGDGTIAPSWLFIAAYLGVWLLFSIAAALLQRLAMGSSVMIQSHAAQAALLVAAGLYQLTPLKSACVRQCRSPAQFLSRYWQPGWYGAFVLGLRHGVYCLGCCWMLMALLFVGGIMNLLWIAGLTALVAAEKLLPWSKLFVLVSSVALILWGSARLIF